MTNEVYQQAVVAFLLCSSRRTSNRSSVRVMVARASMTESEVKLLQAKDRFVEFHTSSAEPQRMQSKMRGLYQGLYKGYMGIMENNMNHYLRFRVWVFPELGLPFWRPL